jgi:hypothetical protein
MYYENKSKLEISKQILPTTPLSKTIVMQSFLLVFTLYRTSVWFEHMQYCNELVPKEKS